MRTRLQKKLLIKVLTWNNDNLSSYLEVRISGEVALHPLVALVLGRRRLGLQSVKVSNPVSIFNLS